MNAIHSYVMSQPNNMPPGMVVGYQYGYAEPVMMAFGVDGAQRPLSQHTLFPVASISKLATALGILALIDAGKFTYDAPIGMLLPDIHADMAPRPLYTLLCHTSGYEIDLPNKEGRYAHGLSWDALAHECLISAPRYGVQQQVQYSNLGYGILGIILERMTGRTFGDAIRELVLQPLGVAGVFGDPGPTNVATIADVRGVHRGTDLEPFNSTFWRSLALPWGGLCTNAVGALALIDAFLPHSSFLSPSTIQLATTNSTANLSGGFMHPLLWQPCPWGLGPELRGSKQPHWLAPCWPAHSFGHSGASGMLVWADAENMFRIVILGTRVADGGWLLRHAPRMSELLWHEVIG